MWLKFSYTDEVANENWPSENGSVVMDFDKDWDVRALEE